MFFVLFINFVKNLNTVANVMAIPIYELEDSTTVCPRVRYTMFPLTNSYAPVSVSSPYKSVS